MDKTKIPAKQIWKELEIALKEAKAAGKPAPSVSAIIDRIVSEKKESVNL